MKLASDYTLTNTESEVLSIIRRFHCISKEQLHALITKNEWRTKENVEFAAKGLVKKGFIYEDSYVYKITSIEKVDQILIDAVWIMIKNLDAKACTQEALYCVVPPPSDDPVKLVYLKNNKLYYVAYIASQEECNKLLLLEERLRSYGNRKVQDVKIMIFSRDKSVGSFLPKIHYPNLKIYIRYKDIYSTGVPGLYKLEDKNKEEAVTGNGQPAGM